MYTYKNKGSTVSEGGRRGARVCTYLEKESANDTGNKNCTRKTSWVLGGVEGEREEEG